MIFWFPHPFKALITRCQIESLQCHGCFYIILRVICVLILSFAFQTPLFHQKSSAVKQQNSAGLLIEVKYVLLKDNRACGSSKKKMTILDVLITGLLPVSRKMSLFRLSRRVNPLLSLNRTHHYPLSTSR